jgi:hypothetical protein
MRWFENILPPLRPGTCPQDFSHPAMEATSPSEKIAWLLFCATSLQMMFLQPSIVLVLGERTNMFSGLLAALSLAATLWAAKKMTWSQSRWESAICLILAVLLMLSGFLSVAPLTNTFRGFALLAPALGGFWGARILLATPSRQRSFLLLSLAMLTAFVLIGLVSRGVSGQITTAMDPKYHSLATKVMLLWFAPLALLWGRSYRKILGVILIALSYLLLLLTQLRSAMAIPLILGGLAVFCGGMRLKYFLLILLALSAILIYSIRHLPVQRTGLQYEPAYYRAEYLMFSWHIAAQHPLLGIGLLTPREEFLQDYAIKYPYVTREKFRNSLHGIIVADNMFLTFMVGVGFPFLVLYSFSLIKLLIGLWRAIGTGPTAGFIPPLALLLPLAAGILSFFVYDLLLHPQVCWFFHLLLGLIPWNVKSVQSSRFQSPS